ncbi:MAG: hypothetical protein OER97_08725 [Gammaproteobacteria bacterium]|nr:hypothetical protein [Gammaproteobacteria bacterium]
MNTIVLRAFVILLACIAMPQETLSQKATEVYIPIGSSPGVSESKSFVGTIKRVNYEARSIELVGQDGTKTIYVSDDTLYYLDRSVYGKKNTAGEMHDCKVGLRVEVFEYDDTVAWVKIKAD